MSMYAGRLGIRSRRAGYPVWVVYLSFLLADSVLPIAQRSRRVVPLRELWALHLDIASQSHPLAEGGRDG
jgi:hypothetical protein